MTAGKKVGRATKTPVRRALSSKKKGHKPRPVTPPAMGERRAIGGTLPQYEAFARFAYRAILGNELISIKVADPEAGNLDDIQYSTKNEVQAYQVKWSNKPSPTPFTFKEFIRLLPEFVSAWKKIKTINEGTGKKIIVNLLTNRPLSKNDSIRAGSKKAGSFFSFHEELWIPLVTGSAVSVKWEKVFQQLLQISGLKENKFRDFANHFVLTFNYSPSAVTIDIDQAKKRFDLNQLVLFLFNAVADKKIPVEYTLEKLAEELEWEERFATVFNHELIVDARTYQPITSTLEKLSKAVERLKGGYVFLLGGPGTGKSTLLTQWLKGRKERVARYYVFDFINPSSNLNYSDRGETVSMLFDLVMQVRQQNVFEGKVLPHKDIHYLKSVFDRQLGILGERYLSEGIKTFILIDGLDHINREYKNVSKNLLADLPHPKSLPEGVYIIMGSQKFDFSELSVDIRSELSSSQRKIIIDPLAKLEVYKYLDSVGLSLEPNQKKIVYELSQGHPLYLSYVVQHLKSGNDFNATTASLVKIEGDISIYYEKIWQSIGNDLDLIKLLGLVATIRGAIRLDFVREWNFDENVLQKFRERAHFLFTGNDKELNFFHNSFRHFLLSRTCVDILSGKYDEKKEQYYHNQLATYYKNSSAEKPWPFAYHFFAAQNYDAFLNDAAPLLLLDQLYEYCPVEKVREDLKRGVTIAKLRKDVNILTSYLFALSELETRAHYLDPASFIDELNALGKIDEIKAYLRDENILWCSVGFTLDAVLKLIAAGEIKEARLIFSLAEPAAILENKIEFDESQRADEKLSELEKWFFVAPYFYKYNDLIRKIKEFAIIQGQSHSAFDNDHVRLRLLAQLGFGLVALQMRDQVIDLLDKINLRVRMSRPCFFAIVRNAIEACIDEDRKPDGLRLLKYLLRRAPYKRMSNEEKIIIADLRFKLGGDITQLKKDLDGVSQPASPSYERLSTNLSLDIFTYRIKLNKLLRIAGIGVSIYKAVPGNPNVRDGVLIDFERKLCLIAELQGEGVKGENWQGNLMTRILPIIAFYYNDHKPSTYWFSLEKVRGRFFEYLIQSVSLHGADKLKAVGDGLIEHFALYEYYWPAQHKREVIVALATHGYPQSTLNVLLEDVEMTMLDEQSDVSGRITECFRQVKAWISLRDFPKAEHMIRKAISESMGVGYRKDYQISIWIEWLAKVNRDRPEFAKERIKWILARLHHVRNTTEPGPFLSAAKATLRASFQMHFSAGVEQLVWQLENELIHFEEGFYVYIKASLDQKLQEDEMSFLVDFYTNAFLYFATDESPSVVRKIINKTYHEFRLSFFRDIVRKLDSEIRIHALEETRHGLILEIQEAIKELGLRPEELIQDLSVPLPTQTDRGSSSGNELVVRPDYKHVGEEEVLAQATTFDSIFEWVKNEDGANSHFDWDKVISAAGKNFSLDQVRTLATSYEGRKGSFYFSSLSKLALDLGDSPLAEELAIKSIECSSPSGWLVRYDGGSRVAGFDAFGKVDKTRARELAFDMFADDVINSNYSNSWIEDLDDILPFLTDGYSLTDGWPVVQNYLDCLFPNADPAGDLPDLERRNLKFSDSIIELLVHMSKYPHSVIHERAEKLLAIFLTRMQPEASDFLKTLVAGDGADQNFFMRIVMALHAVVPERSQAFTNELHSLAVSDNFFLRFNARKILLYHDPALKLAETFRPLPMVYSLHLPKEGKAVDETRDFLGSYVRFAKYLAKDTGVKLQNILHRWEQLVKNVAPTKTSDASIDSRHLDHYKRIGINYPSHKSKYLRINQALLQLVTELLDAGAMKYEHAASYMPLNDAFYCRVEPAQRPAFIVTMNKTQNFLSNDWVKTVSKSERLSKTLTADSSGGVIIAEYTELHNVGWGVPTETFMSQVSVLEEQVDRFYIFQTALNINSDRYLSDADFGENIVVMRDHNFLQYGAVHSWLALNPEVARRLGWMPDEAKLFAWKDHKGETMVESIFWADGNTKTRPPHHDSEVGEGWYVIATPEGFRQLSAMGQTLYLEKRLVRVSDYDNQRREDSADIFLNLDEIE